MANNESECWTALAVLAVALMFALLSLGCATKGDIRRLEKRIDSNFEIQSAKLKYHVEVLGSRIESLDRQVYSLTYNKKGN